MFHKAVDHIYKDPELNKAISELEYMARYDAVTQDLKDLGEEPYKFDKELPHETGNKAVGWLYCAEGSNLGAAFCSNTRKSWITPANTARATSLRIRTGAANTGAPSSST
ncbi:Haem utilisation protein [Neisseria gonorrhoeae]|uniref:Haem utilisation protein n=1 Tax=Neisseria gonorrhoeae TaxID=485 RepID=A0A378VWK3_NEIGO|nr:Haem utilisation protein [Neisseria gonorrhoeae]